MINFEIINIINSTSFEQNNDENMSVYTLFYFTREMQMPTSTPGCRKKTAICLCLFPPFTRGIFSSWRAPVMNIYTIIADPFLRV